MPQIGERTHNAIIIPGPILRGHANNQFLDHTGSFNPVQYEEEKAGSGVTALGGLPVRQDLIKVSALCEAIKKYVAVCGKQGWLDLQMMLALIFLNLPPRALRLFRLSGISLKLK